VCVCRKDVGRGGDQDTGGSNLQCRYKTDETLILYDQSSCSVADDVTVSTSQMTSYHVVSVLLRRLKQDGFRVYLLDGKPAGLAVFPFRDSLRLSLSLSLFSFSSCPSFGDFILQIKPVSNQNSVQNSV